MSWKPWKRFEVEVAKALGGRRRIRVQYSESIEDVVHPTLSIECKYGGQVPKCCVVSHSMTDGVWVLIPSRYWGRNVHPYTGYFLRDKFIRDGISQAIKYNPDKIPLLCVKPKRYKGFMIIMRYSDYLKTSFTTAIPEPPLRLPKGQGDLFVS